MKSILRESLILRRNSLSQDYILSASEKIVDTIVKSSDFTSAKSVGIYYPINNEVDILKLVNTPGKSFYLPKVSGNTMNFYEYHTGDKLSKDDTGVLSPVIDSPATTLDALYVPCVGYNATKTRLGFGKGFYDRFYKTTNIKIKKIILVAYSFQEVDFQAENHDLKADGLITEETPKARTAVILAGGSSSRMTRSHKCLYQVNNKFLYEYSLEAFDSSFKKIVVLPKYEYINGSTRTDCIYLIGGDTRFNSMLSTQAFLAGKYTYIHDGARPYLTTNLVTKLITYEKKYDAYYLAKSPVNALRLEDELLDNTRVVVAETPQVFKTEYIIKLNSTNEEFKDDVAAVLNQLGIKSHPIIHNSFNEKITIDSDFEIFKKTIFKPLIGHSFDIHPLVSHRPLILGGLTIEAPKGLDGVSDGDCLLHAISESIFGALNIGDLGTHFPPSDIKNQGLSSLEIIKYAQNELIKYNKYIINIDCLIYYEGTKLKPYYNAIKQNLQNILKIDRINIKATTTEKIGKIGSSEAIGCEAVVLLGEK